MFDDTPETPKQRLEKIDRLMEDLKRDRADTLARISGGGGSASERVTQEEQDAATYDKLTPGELMHLYTNDREQWQRLLDAKERQGLRKLMGR